MTSDALLEGVEVCAVDLKLSKHVLLRRRRLPEGPAARLISHSRIPLARTEAQKYSKKRSQKAVNSERGEE